MKTFESYPETRSAASPSSAAGSFLQELRRELRARESERMRYWTDYDPFLSLRMRWRAQILRHLFHVLPGQEILEVGSGGGQFTAALQEALRGECSLTALTFQEHFAEETRKRCANARVITVKGEEMASALQGRRFDCLVAHHMMGRSPQAFLKFFHRWLKPGGRLLFFEPNPWNPYRRMRRWVQSRLPLPWKQPVEPFDLNMLTIYRLFSEMGFTHINCMTYDFLYAPVPRWFLWPAKNMSVILENMPLVCHLAGSLVIWARQPGETARSVPGQWDGANFTPHEDLKGRVSFVVLCHNEVMNLDAMLNGLRLSYGAYIHEIIIVDDNSTDGTGEKADRAAEEDSRVRVIHRCPPAGVGRALKDGIAASTGDYVMTMDCDFHPLIPELRDLFDRMAEGDADVVVGSRFSRDSVLLNYSFAKIMANRCFHVLANLLLGRHFRDISNNLKLFRGDLARKINVTCVDFAANAELGLKPLLTGYRVREVPISWFNRSLDMGESSFRLAATGWNYTRLLFRLWAKTIAGRIEL